MLTDQKFVSNEVLVLEPGSLLSSFSWFIGFFVEEPACMGLID
jgi:hypothetical protein